MASEGGEGAARRGLTRKRGPSASPGAWLQFGKRERFWEEPGDLFHPQKAGGLQDGKAAPSGLVVVFFPCNLADFRFKNFSASV